MILAGLFVSNLSPHWFKTADAAEVHTAAAPNAMNWHATGPMGGDVRSLVIDPQDPQRLYFGTLDGQIYTSADSGGAWSRVANFNRPGLYRPLIVIREIHEPTLRRTVQRAGRDFSKTTRGGGVGEATELKGEALHSLTQSPSNPDILVAGSNRGVFRSADAGDTWKQLPTSATPGLINVESLAVDPRDPDVIYAGTWYLPYKTTDGGGTWSIIKNGIIDDSDIFAIEIDAENPDHVIASACSGIYETKNAGASWRKVMASLAVAPTRASSNTPRSRRHFEEPPKALASTDGGQIGASHSRQNCAINALDGHPKKPAPSLSDE